MMTEPKAYKIARRRGPEDLAHTYTVVFEPTQENLSYHESEAEARTAIRRYEAADKRRKSA